VSSAGGKRRRGAILVAALGLSGVGAAGATTGILSVGDVIPAGEPSPGNPNQLRVDETVLAKGTASIAGPWHLTAHTSEESGGQPGGLPCIRLVLLQPPSGTPIDSSGFCGDVGQDFGAVSLPVVDGAGEAELLVLGLAPEDAATVRVRSGTGDTAQATTREGPPSFSRGDLFVLTAREIPDQGELVAVDRSGRVNAKRLDISGFADRFDAVQGIAGQPGAEPRRGG
jgi:hypothetical protein